MPFDRNSAGRFGALAEPASTVRMGRRAGGEFE
jgi:hypothetical protein